LAPRSSDESREQQNSATLAALVGVDPKDEIEGSERRARASAFTPWTWGPRCMRKAPHGATRRGLSVCDVCGFPQAAITPVRKPARNSLRLAADRPLNCDWDDTRT
jgi:hypothetical protein